MSYLPQPRLACTLTALTFLVSACGGGGSTTTENVAAAPAAPTAPAAPVAPVAPATPTPSPAPAAPVVDDTPVIVVPPPVQPPVAPPVAVPPPPPSSPPPSARSLTGTVSIGVRIEDAEVVVSGANSGAVVATMAADGTYSADVSTLTAPYRVEAAGRVGGRLYILSAVATDADLGGVVNVTPLTDLVAANLIAQPTTAFRAGRRLTSADAANRDAELAALKARLQPVLDKLGVDAAADLQRTAFAVTNSPLSKVLDVVRVSVDSSTNTATLTNIVTQGSIVDNLAVPAATDATTTLASDGMETAADDIVAVRKALTDYVGLFATAAPSEATIRTYLVNAAAPTGTYGFRIDDFVDTQFIAQQRSDPSLIGGTFDEISFDRINYVINPANNTSPRAYVRFRHRNSAGVQYSYNLGFQLVKGTDGAWRFRGNGRILDMSMHPVMLFNQTGNCTSTGFEIPVYDRTLNNSTTTAYVELTGPGLPAGGLRLDRPASGNGAWLLNAAGSDGFSYYTMQTNCPGVASAGFTDAQMEAVAAGGVYTFTGRTATGDVSKIANTTNDSIFTETVIAGPLPLSAGGLRPAVATTPALASYTGGPITVSGSQLFASYATDFFLQVTSNNVYQSESTISTVRTESSNTYGTANASFNLPAANGVVTRRVLTVNTLDEAFREFRTLVDIR